VCAFRVEFVGHSVMNGSSQKSKHCLESHHSDKASETLFQFCTVLPDLK
jgi:hypothetical protein